MRPEKQLLLDEIQEKIEASKGFLIARYKGLTAPRARELRDVLAEANGEFEAVKKRVFYKALQTSDYKMESSKYSGHIGLFIANDDVIALSKIALKFSDDNDNAFQLLGGVVDGALLSGEEIEAIAKLPGINELRAQFVATLEAPMQQMVSLLDTVLASVPAGLEERSKKLEA